MRAEEKPWIAVTTGVSTNREAKRYKIGLIVNEVELPACSRTWATWSISHTLASMGVLGIGRRADAGRCPPSGYPS
jgi:hypothetical protein